MSASLLDQNQIEAMKLITQFNKTLSLPASAGNLSTLESVYNILVTKYKKYIISDITRMKLKIAEYASRIEETPAPVVIKPLTGKYEIPELYIYIGAGALLLLFLLWSKK